MATVEPTAIVAGRIYANEINSQQLLLTVLIQQTTDRLPGLFMFNALLAFNSE